MEDLPKTYDQQKEADIYKLWELSGYFNPDNLKGEPFTIMMPPPNVTGVLHVGHALFLTLQDIMIRFERMRGKKTLWLPGTDHAAIATNAKVESIIYKQEGKTRHDLGREEFERRAAEFAKNSHDTIVHQVRRMGASCDWSREAYTLDEPRSLAVRTAFKKMYDAGLIYRGNRIVNWDPKLKTTVSDDEIEWKEETAPFYYLKYGPFVIGTARPETKFGDKYVVMHPDDKRYASYQHGQQLEVEWINGKVTTTVIKDEAVDPQFGTGVMTITPWHDAADFEIAQRHKLQMEQIIDFDGKLLPIAAEFAGLYITKARPKIVEKLKDKELLVKIDDKYSHRVATNSRGGGTIEPQIKEQWWVDVNKKFAFGSNDVKGIKQGQTASLKMLMTQTVKSGQVKIIPEHFEKIYFHWIDNLKDWCISRQLWFGHQIPVWYCGGVEKSSQKKMGFETSIAPEVLKGKSRTYRLRNHDLKVGDTVMFENSGTRTLMGRATITSIQELTVGKIHLPDVAHSGKYKNTTELIAAFKRIHPEKDVSKDTPAWIYDYEFHPFSKKDAQDGCGQIIAAIETPKVCPACGGKSLEQDSDTLDTWFSSGLWTFSTLGWPKDTVDLKTFHPTDVLETAYEILFFWVARMILMSTYLIGEIPFHTVYLHGLVKDRERKKMSKSKGDSVNPLEIIDKYGTDALRMALVVGNLPGRDSPFYEEKVKGYRNFANKIWNASRFVLQNLYDYPANEEIALAGENQQIIEELNAMTAETTKLLEAFDFAHAAENLYHYFWHTFADKIIENSKSKLNDPKLRKPTQKMLMTVLTTSLKLLHPFTPFVTEAVWQLKHKNLLMKESWPNKNGSE